MSSLTFWSLSGSRRIFFTCFALDVWRLAMTMCKLLLFGWLESPVNWAASQRDDSSSHSSKPSMRHCILSNSELWMTFAKITHRLPGVESIACIRSDRSKYGEMSFVTSGRITIICHKRVRRMAVAVLRVGCSLLQKKYITSPLWSFSNR